MAPRGVPEPIWDTGAEFRSTKFNIYYKFTPHQEAVYHYICLQLKIRTTQSSAERPVLNYSMPPQHDARIPLRDVHSNTYQRQISQRPTRLPKQERVGVTGLNRLCDVCLSETKRRVGAGGRPKMTRHRSQHYCRCRSCFSFLKDSEAYFWLVTKTAPEGATCGGKRLESAGTLDVSREETTGSGSCIFPLCDRPANSQTLSQMYTDPVSAFVK